MRFLPPEIVSVGCTIFSSVGRRESPCCTQSWFFVPERCRRRLVRCIFVGICPNGVAYTSWRHEYNGGDNVFLPACRPAGPITVRLLLFSTLCPSARGIGLSALSCFQFRRVLQVLGDKAAEADKLFKGEPETALIASILWAFEVCCVVSRTPKRHTALARVDRGIHQPR